MTVKLQNITAKAALKRLDENRDELGILPVSMMLTTEGR